MYRDFFKRTDGEGKERKGEERDGKDVGRIYLSVCIYSFELLLILIDVQQKFLESRKQKNRLRWRTRGVILTYRTNIRLFSDGVLRWISLV